MTDSIEQSEWRDFVTDVKRVVINSNWFVGHESGKHESACDMAVRDELVEVGSSEKNILTAMLTPPFHPFIKLNMKKKKLEELISSEPM